MGVEDGGGVGRWWMVLGAAAAAIKDRMGELATDIVID
jgi:hypothetical protein